jgi:hypothetical protein
MKMMWFIINFFFLFSCNKTENNETQHKPFNYQGEKMKGLSYVAPHIPIDSTHILPLLNINAEWISLMPYGFVGNDTPDFRYVSAKDTVKNGHQWWGESPAGVAQCINLAHKKHLKVMLKPHMWVARGTFTGDFGYNSETDWQIFEKGYREYLLEFAAIAQTENVEMFCIATEMKRSVKERPQFWNKLINDLKAIYKGKLTYAENWDCYKDVPFWKQLDFIGIDGYFPLSDDKSPTIEALINDWKKHKKAISNFSGKMQKPILFTEFGYRSCDYTCEKPWESDFSGPNNELAQANAYEAFFKTVWHEPFFAGAFIWKWFPVLMNDRRHKDTFTPQGKLAESILKKGFDNKFSSKMP